MESRRAAARLHGVSEVADEPGAEFTGDRPRDAPARIGRAADAIVPKK